MKFQNIVKIVFTKTQYDVLKCPKAIQFTVIEGLNFDLFFLKKKTQAS